MITDFKLPAVERALLDKIVERASTCFAVDDSQSLDMDLTACHKYDIALDLEGLLSAPDSDFAHDVFGISRHIDRNSGRLEGFFVPRYSKPEAPAPAEKTCYAFTIAAEIVSGSAFDDIPCEELVSTVRKRLKEIEDQGSTAAFECFDSMPAGD